MFVIWKQWVGMPSTRQLACLDKFETSEEADERKRELEAEFPDREFGVFEVKDDSQGDG